jgi:energy-coupling factor transporter ATP-binding protein EcfA2
MELQELRVQNYRCIDDSGWVPVDDLTCLIGKNESGKTAFMQALEKLNPSYPAGGYTPYEDYPREKWPAYNDRHEEDPDVVASARFALGATDLDAVESAYAEGLLAEPTGVVHKNYHNELSWDLEFDESVLIEYLLGEHDLSETHESRLRDAASLSELPDHGADVSGGTYTELESRLGGDPAAELADEIGADVLTQRLPEFRYIGEYSVMNGTIVVEELSERREEGTLEPGDRVLLSLLSVAGLELDDFVDTDDWRRRLTELETASASISRRVAQYWAQSGDIRIRIQDATPDDGSRVVLDVRVENRTRDVTVEFEQRSHGFRQFFSTFCQLSEIVDSGEDTVVMLDEPGLNLHVRAKQDFLGFLRAELASEHPVVYTTHSPFMIDPEDLDRTRMVRARPAGEYNVFGDVSLADDYTRFPLRNVFELDLMDTLLVRPQTLLVESKADHVYLYVLSKSMRDLGETCLDDRWTVLPVTDAGNIGTFVSLFGGDRLDVAALLDEQPPDDVDVPARTISEYADSGSGSTTEDILSVSLYLEIVNRAYATEISRTGGVPDRITVEDLGGADGPGEPIVGRIGSYFESTGVNDGAFDRDEVAVFFQQNREQFTDDLDGPTRRNLTRLFTDLNNILESFEGVESRSKSLFDTLGLG